MCEDGAAFQDRVGVLVRHDGSFGGNPQTSITLLCDVPGFDPVTGEKVAEAFCARFSVLPR